MTPAITSHGSTSSPSSVPPAHHIASSVAVISPAKVKADHIVDAIRIPMRCFALIGSTGTCFIGSSGRCRNTCAAAWALRFPPRQLRSLLQPLRKLLLVELFVFVDVDPARLL